MKEEENCIKRIEYIELNKTARKKIREDVRRHNENLVRNTIEENKSLKKTKQQLMIGKKDIIAVKRSDRTVTRNKEEIINIFENFYRELYYSEEELGNEDSEETDVEVPDAMKEEVDKVLPGMKNEKSPGEDELIAEMFKGGGEKMKEELAKLFSMCLKKREIPRSWNNAIIIFLYKKGDKERVENYRPISLLSVLYKMFTKVILNRIERNLDFKTGREQAGFRRGFSPMDHIQTLNEAMERTNEYELPLCIGFIYFEKAFDSVSFAAVLNSLEHQGIESVYIKLLRNIYSTDTFVIRLHQER